MKKFLSIGLGLWTIAIITMVTAILNQPSNKELIKSRNELATVREELLEANNRHNAVARSTTQTDFNLRKVEQKTSKELSDAFSALLGGIHSDEEYQHKLPSLQKTLGKKLTDNLYHLGYNNESKIYVIDKPADVLVGFQNINNKHDSVVTVTTKYFLKNNLPVVYVYKLHYDFIKGKVLSFDQTNLEHAGGDHL